MRAEKVRTYNFLRTGLRTTGLVIRATACRVHFGKIDEIVDALLADDEKKRIEEASQA